MRISLCLHVVSVALVCGCARPAAPLSKVDPPVQGETALVADTPAPVIQADQQTAAAPAPAVAQEPSAVAVASIPAATISIPLDEEMPVAPQPRPTVPDPRSVAGAVSPALPAPAWDRAAYERDPTAYLSQVVPARIRDTAQPSADTPFLTAVGGTGFSCAPTKSVVLRAQTDPGMPVSFFSWGLGAFPGSGQTAMSVAADAKGIARAEFAVTPGTVGTVLITAASPVRAGNLTYLILAGDTP